MLNAGPADSSSRTISLSGNHDDGRSLGRESSRRQYQKRKAVGLCAHCGCRAKAEADRRYCQRHLRRMSASYKRRQQARKNSGMCIYCGVRPQFWGVRCLLCRQILIKDRRGLPRGARRALRLYREAEGLFELEQSQAQARFAVRKLIAAGEITGDREKAFRLYAGLDTGGWRTYQEVARLMHISKERVRQLLHPSKLILTERLGGNVPWKPLSVKTRSPARANRKTVHHSVPNTRSPVNVHAVIS